MYARVRMEPEEERLTELTRRLREGVASDAEKEELALYADGQPEVQALVKRAAEERELGGHWLARSEADKRLSAAAKTPLTIAERRVGVALVVGGGVGALFVPAAAVAMVAGAALLTWSILRVRITATDKDPYEDIEQ